MKIQTCNICGATSDLSPFYAGVGSRCAECHRRRVRENRAEKLEYYRAYDAKRFQENPSIAERHRQYQKTDAGKASMIASRKRWLIENADKRAAHIILGNAIRSGRVKKSEFCETCGTNGRIHGHHDDYSQPLSVRWLCQKCHVAVHKVSE
jgi:ribosomal protein S27AE